MRDFTIYLQKSTSYQVEPKLYALNISADSDRCLPPKNDVIYKLFSFYQVKNITLIGSQ